MITAMSARVAARPAARAGLSSSRAGVSAAHARFVRQALMVHQTRRGSACRATDDEPSAYDDEEPSNEVSEESSSKAIAAPPAPYVPGEMSLEDIKAALLDSLFGTERGLKASSEVRAEINELLAQLEAKNPTPAPNEALDLLDGSWKLVYTSNSELLALLLANNLPLVTIGDITQTIDGATETVINKVQVTVPFSTTTVAAQAGIEVRSPKRLQVKFKQGTISTPTITDSLEIPNTITIMGQTLDLRPLQDALRPIEENFSGVTDQIQNLISQSPDLSFPIQGDSAQTWLLTTYLDKDTRISRGDGGSVFVLVKDVTIH